jgi:hypothetical protein
MASSVLAPDECVLQLSSCILLSGENWNSAQITSELSPTDISVFRGPVNTGSQMCSHLEKLRQQTRLHSAIGYPVNTGSQMCSHLAENGLLLTRRYEYPSRSVLVHPVKTESRMHSHLVESVNRLLPSHSALKTLWEQHPQNTVDHSIHSQPGRIKWLR